MQTSVNSLLTVYTAASWQYFINLELRTLSTWHSNQQVDGGHYEAEAEMIVDAIKCMLIFGGKIPIRYPFHEI